MVKSSRHLEFVVQLQHVIVCVSNQVIRMVMFSGWVIFRIIIQQIIVKNYHNIIATLYSTSQKVLEQNLRALTVSRRYHL